MEAPRLRAKDITGKFSMAPSSATPPSVRLPEMLLGFGPQGPFAMRLNRRATKIIWGAMELATRLLEVLALGTFKGARAVRPSPLPAYRSWPDMIDQPGARC